MQDHAEQTDLINQLNLPNDFSRLVGGKHQKLIIDIFSPDEWKSIIHSPWSFFLHPATVTANFVCLDITMHL